MCICVCVHVRVCVSVHVHVCARIIHVCFWEGCVHFCVFFINLVYGVRSCADVYAHACEYAHGHVGDACLLVTFQTLVCSLLS